MEGESASRRKDVSARMRAGHAEKDHHMTRNMKILAAAAAFGALAVAGGGSAFTADNTVPVKSLGYGTAAVSGAAVSDIAYHLTNDRSKTDYVTFTITAVGNIAHASIELNGSTVWTLCDGDGTGDATLGAGTGYVAAADVSIKCLFAGATNITSITSLALSVV
jgi:hypothetical protein